MREVEIENTKPSLTGAVKYKTFCIEKRECHKFHGDDHNGFEKFEH